ncbi:hypothetical protein GEV33_009915 [Tenebrio molitor]|uniref:Major facilitator superfamily domain-containing protein 12-like n=1 Tax=Tenebrio molitor TaxID=7067 RepID=A0A8J6HEC7_TENMO|nr:hypothetical protein GEV33_009915 [Tenebrio molitor]
MNEERRCDWVKKLCYGMGHVYNDLCAAMWFSYTLFYLQIVLQMEATTAGTLIMTGQIVDSLATPVVGCAVDRTGARRAWHLAGIFSSLIFYCGALTKEDQTDYATIPGDESVDSSGLVTNEDVTHFLKSSIIYKVSLMYMASRLFTTLTLIYIPLYLDEKGAGSESTGDGIRQTIASVPLVCFVASFLTSILVKFRWCGDKVVYLVGIVLALIASVWIKAGSLFRPDGQLYIIASLIGVSGSATMVSSLCLTAEFVKVNGYGGASVYSMVTFTDKLISGGVVLLVQNLQCTPKEMCPHFYEDVLSYVCGLVSLIGLVSLATLHCRLN